MRRLLPLLLLLLGLTAIAHADGQWVGQPAPTIALPDQDATATFFVPLSLQAVLLYGRRQGFLWIGAFTLVMAVPKSVAL